MEVVLSKDLNSLREAKGGDKVHKDECVYCFHTPVSGYRTHASPLLTTVPLQVSKGGLYVSLSSFLGLCKNHIQLHHTKTSESLYLHIVHTVKVQSKILPSQAQLLAPLVSVPCSPCDMHACSLLHQHLLRLQWRSQHAWPLVWREDLMVGCRSRRRRRPCLW